MKLFEPKKQRLSHTVIVGGTNFACALAGLLSAQGDSVLIISNNQKGFLSISPSFDGHAIVGDVADPQVLEAANLENADTVVAAADDDNINLLVAQFAREVFGVKHVIALLNDTGRECVYQEFDIPTFSPAIISAKEIIKEISNKKKVEPL